MTDGRRASAFPADFRGPGEDSFEAVVTQVNQEDSSPDSPFPEGSLPFRGTHGISERTGEGGERTGRGRGEGGEIRSRNTGVSLETTQESIDRISHQWVDMSVSYPLWDAHHIRRCLVPRGTRERHGPPVDGPRRDGDPLFRLALGALSPLPRTAKNLRTAATGAQ